MYPSRQVAGSTQPHSVCPMLASHAQQSSPPLEHLLSSATHGADGGVGGGGGDSGGVGGDSGSLWYPQSSPVLFPFCSLVQHVY